MFMCQRDSFLKELSTKVISYNEVSKDQKNFIEELEKLNLNLDPSPQGIQKFYEIILDDTILFPEGGGQPDDHGTLNGIPVLRVIKNGHSALHYVAATEDQIQGLIQPPLGQVTVKLRWERRFDHMQQHSGQHLITAIADSMFGLPTTSWWLGSEDSYIELDAKEVTLNQIQGIEEEVNLRIRENPPVQVNVVELNDPQLKTARGRNLPEDVKGQIRIVKIKGVESNVCCGTHVSSLSQLQVIKLLFAEKKKGKSLLHFLVGNRVLKKLNDTFQREQKLVQILKSTNTELPEAAEKLGNMLTTSRKAAVTLAKDLAVLEANNLKNNHTEDILLEYHRENVEFDFGTTLLREIGQMNDKLILITLKTEGPGHVGHLFIRAGPGVLSGELLKDLGEKISKILDGKGTLRGDLYQAKVNKINARKEALKAIKLFLNEHVTNLKPN